jgi:CheY-like chemotaxis protein
MRILVVDDYRPHGESLRDLLDFRGHEAHYAPSLAEALGCVAVARFDLAFVDYDMPELKGPAVVEKLLEKAPSLRPVIVSGRIFEADALRELGSLPLLHKPVSADAISRCLAAVERELAGRALAVRCVLPLVRLRKGTPILGEPDAQERGPRRSDPSAR